MTCPKWECYVVSIVCNNYQTTNSILQQVLIIYMPLPKNPLVEDIAHDDYFLLEDLNKPFLSEPMLGSKDSFAEGLNSFWVSIPSFGKHKYQEYGANRVTRWLDYM